MNVLVVKLPKGETLDKKVLKQLGEEFLTEVAREIKRDIALRGNDKGDGIPDSPKFIKSFGYKIEKDGVTITSSWEWIEPILEGKKPFKMTWLTKQRGVPYVPFIKPGKVEIRSTPALMGQAWIHPGMAKHTFIQRAFKTVAKKMAPIIAEKQSQELAKMVAEQLK